MKSNKILKNLMIILPAITIAACSPNKEVSKNSQKSKEIINASTDSNFSSNDNNDITTENQVHLQIQQLKKRNIIYFDLNKYDIHPDFSVILDDHVNFLRSTSSHKVIIEGHTDERGTPEYNIALGERRANAVRMYLQSKGIPSDQISIISYGKEKPAILGHDEMTYAKNRRAVLVY